MRKKRSKGKWPPQRGDIFYADLRDTGNGAQRGYRPVIIIQNNIGNTYSDSIIVAAITGAKKKPMPTHVALTRQHGLKMPSTAVLEDIVTIKKQLLLDYLGTVVNTEAEKQLNRALCVSLGLTLHQTKEDNRNGKESAAWRTCTDTIANQKNRRNGIPDSD